MNISAILVLVALVGVSYLVASNRMPRVVAFIGAAGWLAAFLVIAAALSLAMAFGILALAGKP